MTNKKKKLNPKAQHYQAIQKKMKRNDLFSRIV